MPAPQHVIDTFASANPAVYAWLNNSPSSFAASLLAGLKKWGSLTPKQFAAAEKAAIRDAEQAVEKALGVDPVSMAPAITVEKIEKALQSAKSNGIKRPKLILNAFKFTLAPHYGKNAGAIYVKQDAEYLGKVQNGKFVCSSICGDDRRDQIIALAADPAAAAKAHGLKTGICSCCGRPLTDPKSVALGIGPICASKYGFA